MTSAAPDQLSDYLARFDRAAATLPADRRRELRADVEVHLEEVAASASTEAEVRQALDRLGPPEDIVTEAASDLPSTTPAPPRAGSRLLDIGAVVLLLIGGIVLPFVGWVVGVVLLWASSSWTAAEKLLGTLVLPGGLLAPLLLALLPARVAFGSGVAVSGIAQVAGTLLLVVLVVAPLVVAGVLLRRAERRR